MFLPEIFGVVFYVEPGYFLSQLVWVGLILLVFWRDYSAKEVATLSLGFPVLSTLAICLHEGGHAIAFSLVGVPVEMITFTWKGGLTSPDRSANFLDPGLLACVYLVGPVVSMLCAIACFAISKMATNNLRILLRFSTLWIVGMVFMDITPFLGTDGARLLESASAVFIGQTEASALMGFVEILTCLALVAWLCWTARKHHCSIFHVIENVGHKIVESPRG